MRARTAALEEANELMGIEIAERRRAEEERLRAESHLGYLVHNLPAVVYLWQTHENPDGTWSTFVGDHIAPMLGYTPEEWNDGGWRHRVHPHDIEMVDEAARRSIETGAPFRCSTGTSRRMAGSSGSSITRRSRGGGRTARRSCSRA